MSTVESQYVDNDSWVEEFFSKGRLNLYLESSFSQLTALDSYHQDLQATSALFTWIHVFEVGLRNALVRQIILWLAPADLPWHVAIGPHLTAKGRDALVVATRRIADSAKEITPDRMVAALPLVFWVTLLAKNYETSLWTPALHKAFVNLQKANRSQVHDKVGEVFKLRNHIAHQGLISRRDFVTHKENIATVISWLSPEGHAWAQKNIKP
jgi:hypothetical protein